MRAFGDASVGGSLTSSSSTAVKRLATKLGLVLLLGTLALLAFASLASLLETQSERLSDNTVPNPYEDYVTYYAAGRLVLDGNGSNLYNTDQIVSAEHEAMGREVGLNGDLPFFNPPFVALLFAPLSTLSVATFSSVLTVLVVASIFAGGLCLQALVRPHDGKYLALLWLGYFSFVGTAWLALTTQLSMLLFLGWFGFAWFQVRGQPKLSGASLALALVKPQSVVLLLPVLVWKRQWQTLAYFAIAAAPMIVLSLVVAGPSALIEYPRFLLDSTRWEGLGVNTATMFGWNRLLYFLTGDLSPNVGFVLALSVPTVALAAVALRGAWNPRSRGSICKLALCYSRRC